MYFCTGSGFIFHPSCPSPISALFIIGNFSLFLIFSSSFFFHHSRRRGFSFLVSGISFHLHISLARDSREWETDEISP